MNEQNATTAAQDRQKKQADRTDQEPDTTPGSEATRDSDSPAGTEAPHQEEQWESEGGNPD